MSLSYLQVLYRSLVACSISLAVWGCDSDLIVNSAEDKAAIEEEASASSDTHSETPAELPKKLADAVSCVDPDLSQVPTSVSLTLCDGTLANGSLDLASLLESPLCANDGETGCLVLGPTFKAASVSGLLSANIRSGTTVAGVSGSLADCNANGEANCVTNSSYQAADFTNLSEGNIKAGVSVAGIAGQYPSSAYPLSGATPATDLTLANFNASLASGNSFEWFDSSGAPHLTTGSSNLRAGFLAPGVSMFGVTGTAEFGLKHAKAIAAGTKTTISWESFGPVAGIIIVRNENAPVSWTPTRGQAYASGHVAGTHVVVKRITDGRLQDSDTITSGGIYSYKIFAYNADLLYSAPITMGVGVASCGNIGDSCYDSPTALAARVATTPLGKNIEYVAASGSLYVWKEIGGSRILRANGMDEWAIQLSANGKSFSANPYTNPAILVGRVCPPQVYLDDAAPAESGLCLYYTEVRPAVGFIGNHNQTDPRWFKGNHAACGSMGMRTPTLFESVTNRSTSTSFPNADGARTMAGADGVPGAGSAHIWSSTVYMGAYGDSYWAFNSQGADLMARYSHSLALRCVLP